MSQVFRMKLPMGLWLAVGAVGALGCAGSQATLPGVPVHPLMTETLRLHGTASAMMASPSCDAAALARPTNVLELPDDTRVTILLAQSPGEPALPLTMLHLTHLETKRTWCVVTHPDGTPAAIGGEFPSGQYAVSVAEARTAAPRKYEVRVQRL